MPNHETPEPRYEIPVPVAWAVLVLVLWLLMGCAPVIEPTEPSVKPTPTPAAKYLNDNPGLSLGHCTSVTFDAGVFGEETISQCVPAGYQLYEFTTPRPIRVIYSGAGYFIKPNGSTGSIGFTMPRVILIPGDYTVMITGDLSVEGHMPDFVFKANYTIEDVDGSVFMGASDIAVNGGSYKALFTLEAPQVGNYYVSIYLFMVWPMTADSWVTIETMTIER